MEIKAVGCTLPNPDYFLVFHSHTSGRKAVWTQEDRDRFFNLKEALRTLHSDTREESRLNSEQRAALMPPGVTLDDALQSLTPCIIDANRVSKNASYLNRKRDRAEIVGYTGITGPQGIRFVALVKKSIGLRPQPWMLEHILRLGKLKIAEDAPEGELKLVSTATEEEVDINSLEFRSSALMISLARRYHTADCLLEGHLKVVSLPLDYDVKLAANKGGEIVKQIAHEWS